MMAFDRNAFDMWRKYEDVAIHFNDLIMRLRTHALTGVAGVVTVAGLAINFGGKQAPAAEWSMVLFAILFLMIAWTALWILDVGYYNRLLIGAVNAICELEEQSQAANPGDALAGIILSTRVRARSPKHTYFVHAFYATVMVGLILGAMLAGIKYKSLPTSNSPDVLELKLDRVPADNLQFSVGPAAQLPRVSASPLPTSVPQTSTPRSSAPSTQVPLPATATPAQPASAVTTPLTSQPQAQPPASSAPSATPPAQPTSNTPPNSAPVP